MHTDVSPQALVVYWLARLIAKQMYRIWPLSDRGIRTLALLDTMLGLLPPLRSIDHSDMELGSVEVERYLPEATASDRLAGASVLYLHGGGFTFCGIGTHRRIAGRLAQTLSVPVYSVLYRQLPDCGVGSAVHDAYAAYRGLLEICPDPDRVVLAGDSSGAFLAAKICELAAEDGTNTPAAYVGYSAHLNLDVDHRDHDLICNDALMPVSAYRRVKSKWTRGPVVVRGARSMLEVDPAVFPPVFLTAGEGEMFEADIVDFTRILADSGRTVETHVWRRQVHAFPVLDGLLPESGAAIRSTGEFLRKVLAERESGAA
ncbi:MAG: alpha/beta hydrolase [Rhodococcus sp. (in: high G+C Gram-positive bacteria)]|uniref:alpha/beta hydrolase n=1 Tax=Rhodococcus sp. TaxID=1831 RepID=UPI003BB71BA8